MKGIITVSLDIEVIAAIRKKDVNISSITNSFLKSYADLPTNTKKDADIDYILLAAETHLAEMKKKKDKEKKKEILVKC